MKVEWEGRIQLGRIDDLPRAGLAYERRFLPFAEHPLSKDPQSMFNVDQNLPGCPDTDWEERNWVPGCITGSERGFSRRIPTWIPGRLEMNKHQGEWCNFGNLETLPGEMRRTV